MAKAKKNGMENPTLSDVKFAVHEDAGLGRDTIKAWLKKDVNSVYILLAEILRSDIILDAIVDVLYANYQNYHEEKKRSPELNFDGKEESNG